MKHAIRGAMLTFRSDPFIHGVDASMVYDSDAIIRMVGGRIAEFGPASVMLPRLEEGEKLTHHANGLILPGFIDCHVHYPQIQVIGSYGVQLMEWLSRYTFPAEQSFKDKDHAREVAQIYLRENLRNGITSASSFCTIFPQSVDALFEEAMRYDMRLMAGKVMMDRNAPAGLLDTAQSSYDDSKALIERWHNKGRFEYVITPRFAPTSTPEQLEAAAALARENPGMLIQSHVSENLKEIALVRELFRDCASYTDVYRNYGLLRPRAIYGHGIHLSDKELSMFHEADASIAHCPTSNLFIGSGCFRLEDAQYHSNRPVRVGLATDLGGGTSFSMLQTMGEAYKVSQLNSFPLSGPHAFYLATRGSARALHLDDKIGSIEPGMEADLVVLDMHSTPLIDYRMKYCESIAEALFIQMTLADDRAVLATYVNGTCVYNRGENA